MGKRNDIVMKEKNKRLSWMDRKYRGNREKYIMESVLRGRDVLLEPNPYPYHLPPDIQHWTIWSTANMGHGEICEYVTGWLRARQPNNVMAWNYDDNRGNRTIDIWHVHIYFQGSGGTPPVFNNASSEASLLSGRPPICDRSPCSV